MKKTNKLQVIIIEKLLAVITIAINDFHFSFLSDLYKERNHIETYDLMSKFDIIPIIFSLKLIIKILF